jgi:hypothetical protein
MKEDSQLHHENIVQIDGVKRGERILYNGTKRVKNDAIAER